MTMRSSRPEQVLMAHPSGKQSAAGRYDLQRMARVKCLSGLGNIRGDGFWPAPCAHVRQSASVMTGRGYGNG
jgi:hypothetical protein